MSFNPYDQLGIPDDASEAIVRAAYKRRAKATHPDRNGGDGAGFRLVQLAYEILMDPARRARDGTADEAKPDNSRPVALGLIDGHMGPIIQKYIMGGFKVADDPRHMNVIQIIAEKLEGEIAQANNSIHQAEQAVAFMRDMAGRFETDDDTNALAGKFAAQIAATEKSIVDVREGIRLRLWQSISSRVTTFGTKSRRSKPTKAHMFSTLLRIRPAQGTAGEGTAGVTPDELARQGRSQNSEACTSAEFHVIKFPSFQEGSVACSAGPSSRAKNGPAGAPITRARAAPISATCP